MNWTTKENTLKVEYQEDEVGNILQRAGGVRPKACQKCKKQFKSEYSKKEINQKIGYYVCTECNFSNSDSTSGLDHMIGTSHKLIKKSKDKIMGYETILTGSKAHITKTDDDVLILCGDCNAK